MPGTPALVSVIIPCYNARPWVADTLRSAGTPTAGPVEVIVVDDGSTDGSADLVQAQFPQVHLIRTENRGVSHARNVGLQRSAGQYLVFLDSDDLLAPRKIDRQVALLEKTGADVAYGNWQRLRPGPDKQFRPADRIERAMARSPELELIGLFWCPTGAYLFRRSIVEKVGGFSPRLPVIQDARFALDCALRGAKFVHDPEVACLYRVHDTGSVSTRSRQAFVRDCLTNAAEVGEIWSAGAGLTAERRQALLEVFDFVARASCGQDPSCFADACELLARYRGGAALPGRLPARVVTRLLGPRRTYQLRAWLRPAAGAG